MINFRNWPTYCGLESSFCCCHQIDGSELLAQLTAEAAVDCWDCCCYQAESREASGNQGLNGNKLRWYSDITPFLSAADRLCGWTHFCFLECWIQWNKLIFRLFPIISISQKFFSIFFLILEKIGIDEKVICYHNISN